MKVHMLRKITLYMTVVSVVSCALLIAKPSKVTPLVKDGQDVTPVECQLIAKAKRLFDKNLSEAKTAVQPGYECTVDRFTCTFKTDSVSSRLYFVEHHKQSTYAPESPSGVANLNSPVEVKFIGSDPKRVVLVQRKGHHRHLKTVELAEAFNA